MTIDQLNKEREDVYAKYFALQQKYSNALEKQLAKQNEELSTLESLSELDIASLNSIALDKKSDSSFVRKLVLYLYKEDETKISQRSVRGVPARMITHNDTLIRQPEKRSVSPIKMLAIRKHFHQRIANVQPNEIKNRSKETYLNRLINQGIANISRRLRNAK